MTGSRVRTCVTTPILDTLHFSVNGPSRHAMNCAESPVNDLVDTGPGRRQGECRTKTASRPGTGRIMPVLPAEAHIRCPAEKIFDVITDFGGQNRWLAKSSAFRGTTAISSGPVTLG